MWSVQEPCTRKYLSENENGGKAYNGLAVCDIYEKDYDGALANIQKGLSLSGEEDKRGLLYNEIVAYEYKLDFLTAKAKMTISHFIPGR